MTVRVPGWPDSVYVWEFFDVVERQKQIVHHQL